MLPILFLASRADIFAIFQHLPTLLFATTSGLFAFLCILKAGNYMPVATSNSIRQAVLAVGALILGWVYLNEYLSYAQLIVLSGIVLTAIGLSLSRSVHPHLDSTLLSRGIALSVIAGIGHSITFFFFNQLSHEVNPFVASYFWEVVIGFLALFYMLALKAVGHFSANAVLSGKDATSLALMSLLTIVGTVSYSMAVQHGPYALATALMPCGILFTLALGWYLFKEKLKPIQLALIATSTALIAILRFVS